MILPNGWTIKPAKEICEKIQDGTHFSPKNQFSNGPFPYVTAKNVRPWGLDLNNLTYLEEEEHRPIYERSDTRKGDVLLVKDGVNAGDTAINTIQGEISLLSSVCFLRPKKILRSKFLRYYLQSPQCQAELLGNLSGSAIRRIILRKIRLLPIIVAPLEEQDAIIKGLDTQLSRLDEAVTTLQGIQAKLKQARASILKAAVEGRLVETEAELAIRQGRTHELAAELLDTMDRQKNKKSAITSETAEPQWDAPTSWEWTNIGYVSLKVKYGTSAKCQERGDGIPVIRMGNIQDGKIHMDKIKYLPKTHHEFPEQLLRKGEVLFNRTNSIDLVGKTAVFRGDSPHACASYIIRVLPADGISSEFLAITLNSPFGRAWARHEASQQVGQANINSKKLMNFRFPLPPRLEQLRIKEEVEHRFSVLDQVEATVTASLARCGKMRQAILKRAFEGRLMPAA